MNRVALVIHRICAGGAERVMATMANHWAAEGREVILLTLDDGTKPPFYGLHPRVEHRSLGVTGVSGNPWRSIVNNVRRVRVLRAALKDAAPEVVVSFMASVNVLVLLAAEGLEIPVIVSERVDPGSHPIGRVWDALRQVAYRRASRVVCQSACAMDYFSGKIRSHCVVIPNPVPESRALKRPEALDGSGRKVVLGMGRLEDQKGFDLLISAFGELVARHPSWHLQIWGEGTHRQRLESLICTTGLQERVRLCGVTRHPADELRRADLFVLSSRYEGFPNVLCEAMACGLPVIAFDCPCGPREIIRDGIDGWLVPPGDSMALSQAMERLMASEEERGLLAASAPEVTRRFSVGRVMSQWCDLADEVIRERGKAGRPGKAPAAIAYHEMGMSIGIQTSEGEKSAPSTKEFAVRCRVLFVIRALTCGGAERQLVELVKGIDKARFLVTVATFYEGGELSGEMRAIPGVRLVELRKKGRWDLAGFLVRFIRLVREVWPDVVHGYMGVSNELALLARAVCGSRAVWGIRGSACDYTLYKDWGRGFSHWVGIKLSRFADCIIVNSEAGRVEHMAEGFEGKRMRVIRNGIDTDRFRPDREAGLQMRRDWGIPPEVPVIGIVARLDPMKDHPVFLHAAASLASRRPEVCFVCVGDGPEPYRLRLHQLAAELGVEGRLEWRAARSDVAAVYNALTILTSSSSFGEGFSNVLGEAMACGTPVVATDVGDAAVIVSGRGALIPPGCPEKLVEAWEGLLDEGPAARARRARRGRACILRQYSVAQLVSRTEAVLLEALPCRK